MVWSHIIDFMNSSFAAYLAFFGMIFSGFMFMFAPNRVVSFFGYLCAIITIPLALSIVAVGCLQNGLSAFLHGWMPFKLMTILTTIPFCLLLFYPSQNARLNRTFSISFGLCLIFLAASAYLPFKGGVS